MPKIRDVEMILTDWSGVMSDDRKPVYESNMRMLEARDRERLTFEEWLEASAATPVDFIKSQGLPVPDPDAMFTEYRLLFERVCQEGLRPCCYTDALEFLSQTAWSERENVVISAHPIESLKNEAILYGLNPYIAGYVGNVQNKTLEIKKAYRARPEFAIYLGDTVFDIRAARAAGVRSVAVATGYHTEMRLRDERPDYLVRSLTELRRLIG